MVILDGKKYRDELLLEYEKEIKSNKLKIELDIILIGNNDASRIYVNNKIKFCEKVGIKVVLHEFPDTITNEEIKNLIVSLSNDENVTGIILQSPVPNQVDFNECTGLIKATKDIDGFTCSNVFDIYANRETLVPCTVKGIIKLLEKYDIDIDGKNVVVLGRSEIVGRPLALSLLNRNASVSVLHSHTKNIEDYTKNADIIISAIGKAKYVKESMVKAGAVIVDVGINRENGKVCGDVDFENVKDKCSYITPVPGGVGPMTIAMIIDNLIIASRLGGINNE